MHLDVAGVVVQPKFATHAKMDVANDVVQKNAALVFAMRIAAQADVMAAAQQTKIFNRI